MGWFQGDKYAHRCQEIYRRYGKIYAVIVSTLAFMLAFLTQYTGLTSQEKNLVKHWVQQHNVESQGLGKLIEYFKEKNVNISFFTPAIKSELEQEKKSLTFWRIIYGVLPEDSSRFELWMLHIIFDGNDVVYSTDPTPTNIVSKNGFNIMVNQSSVSIDSDAGKRIQNFLINYYTNQSADLKEDIVSSSHIEPIKPSPFTEISIQKINVFGRSIKENSLVDVHAMGITQDLQSLPIEIYIYLRLKDGHYYIDKLPTKIEELKKINITRK